MWNNVGKLMSFAKDLYFYPITIGGITFTYGSFFILLIAITFILKILIPDYHMFQHQIYGNKYKSSLKNDKKYVKIEKKSIKNGG